MQKMYPFNFKKNEKHQLLYLKGNFSFNIIFFHSDEIIRKAK